MPEFYMCGEIPVYPGSPGGKVRTIGLQVGMSQGSVWILQEP